MGGEGAGAVRAGVSGESMEEFVAFNSRWRLALIALGTVGFVVLGMLMVGAFGEVPSSRRYSADFTETVGWLCILFFGLCGIVIVKKFADDTPQLMVGPTGIRWSPWSDQLIPWQDIMNVTTWSHRRQKVIILHLKNPDHFPGRGLAAKLAGANRMLTGGDISISMTGTNRSYDDAMAAIATFRRAPARPQQ